MEKSSSIEQINYGPAGVTMSAGDKLTQISFGLITGEDVKITPIEISGVETHTCEYDEDQNISRRKFNDGSIQKVSQEKMKKIRDYRKIHNRKIDTIKTTKNIDIEK